MTLCIPPPLQAVIVAVLMMLTARLSPPAALAFAGQGMISILFASAGLALGIAAVGLFGRAKTTVTPLKPEKASALVITGPYRFTRNPMYLGLVLLLTGWGLWLGNPANLIWLAGFVFYITAFQIKPEEAALRAKFGADYAAYCQRVRRWL